VRSLIFILVLVALGVLGVFAASLASGAPVAASGDQLPTTVRETTTRFNTTQATTIVQTTPGTVLPKPVYLLAPKDGAVIRLSARRLLRFIWLGEDRATYYNFQLYRGTKRILGVLPTRPSYQLAKRWTYLGAPYALKTGTYAWYVWPGFGKRIDAEHGALLGSSTFRVVP
jgi:hypothetical protein